MQAPCSFGGDMLRRLTRKIRSCFGKPDFVRVMDYFPSGGIPKGHVLVSYIPGSLVCRDDDRCLRRHSNSWESLEIARIFTRNGYAVDAISWDDASFVPKRDYAAVFDISANLARCSQPGTYKFFHATGSDPLFSNKAERERLESLKARRGVSIAPRRFIKEADVALFHGNLAKADTVTLIGNEVTSATFPDLLRRKLHRVDPTGSYLSRIRNPRWIDIKREFVWFNGAGAVHKGLDLVLEAFARHPELVLHVIGPYLKERDFTAAYEHELTRCPNIISHGFLYPSSRRFQEITRNVLGFVSPSCSEGISTSAVTCMHYGMVPVVSRNSGIDMTEDMGRVLDTCTIEEIEEMVLSLADTAETEIRRMIAFSQEYALNRFSRKEFSRSMGNVIARALCSC